MLPIKRTLSRLIVASFTVVLTFSAIAKQGDSRGMQRPERPNFSSLDLDNNNVVTFSEFEQSQVPNDDHATIFGHIDADGDGEITEEEFTNHKPPRRS